MMKADVQTPVLDAASVSKRFGAVVALRDASLRVNRGEVVALMGANGAGKSTFVKILTGALKPDGGHVRIHGREAHVGSPAEARRSGLVPVYQEPSLIPDLTVGDNLRLCNISAEPFQHWVRELGIIDLHLDETIKNLPLATLRILDLARAIASKPDVLLLDEMTAALPSNLVERVLKVVRQLADNGCSIIYISHRFAEIAGICDRTTILRDGATVGDLAIVPGVEERAVELMLGAAISAAVFEARETRKTAEDKIPRLRVRNLGTGARLEDVSLDLYKGEVLGVVALEGQGQDELFDALSGNRRAAKGTIEVDGSPVSFHHPADAIALGIGLVPGDRAHALAMSRSVRENIAIPQFARIGKWGPVAMRDEARRVNRAVERMQIDMRAQGEVRRLSGGNQQKVTIARWIASGIETLLLFDPSRGIDVRTKRQIYDLVRELASQGTSVLFYTSELGEIQAACDRAVVIFNGRVVDVISASEATEANLLRAAHGLSEKAAVHA
ncbi:sugar ABC transporter ATP-binding protein [Ensifer sp. B1-9]|uniref:sugar ABC transporter ATP-binding protein n=1 Tax=Ensifer sp. B1-9 TaxID=3141455 RepID=UPI003D231DB5